MNIILRYAVRLIIQAALLLASLGLLLLLTGQTALAISSKTDGGAYPVEVSPDCGYVYALTEPAIPIPCEAVSFIERVWMSCEVRGWWERWDSPASAIGALGERGASQLMPLHRAGMAKVGLNYDLERDRIVYSVGMWEKQGGNPWTCK